MMTGLFLAPEAWPFALALVLLIAITVIEGTAQLFGFQVLGWQMEIDSAAWGDAWLGWLHLGKVPLLILLLLLLTSFSLVGYVLLAMAWGLFGVYPPAWVSVPCALFVALPMASSGGRAIARWIPRDESSAVPLETLVGRIAVVINGTARVGFPAQARVRHEAGQVFYIHIEPDSAGIEFQTGDSVLLVRQISGSRFQAIANPRPDLL